MKPVVIVAGAGPGIGTSIARAFGAEEFAIALLARESPRLAKRHAEITAAGVTAALVRLHRGTNEGIEIHFRDGASPLAGMHDV